jgi:hypothetical protein
MIRGWTARSMGGQGRVISTYVASASMHFPSRVCIILALLLLVSLSPCLLVSLPSCHGQEDERVPLFRRLLLSPERLEEELKRVEEGVLVRLPLAEFDALVKSATQASTRKEPPRLLEARYHATLKEEGLIGEGQWKLVHKGPGPGLLNLEPFNLALRQARFENGDALIAAFDGKIPALLVETAGERTVSLDWSARAEAGREGLQFHLEIPPCPVALLELDVPAGRGVTVLNDGALLSGPYEAEMADLRRWKIVCGGRRIDIRILPADRLAAGTEQTSAPLVRQKTTQKLHPEGLDATFELTLDGLSRGMRELVCECDPELRLRDVAGPNVEGYSLQSGGREKPSRLTIRLREPMRAGTWQILCLAPLNGRTGVSPDQKHGGTGGSPVAWHSPSLRLINGVPRGETLTLWLHPELRVESWDPGSFRLSSSELDRATGSQVLTLLGGGLGPPRRPTARLQVHGVEFRAHQLAWWRCDASGMVLTVQIGWDVSQGQLFQLPVLLPPDWRVEKVETTPAGLLRDWRVRGPAGRGTLLVDLTSPLTPRSNGDAERAAETIPRPAIPSRTRLPLLTVHLRPGWPGPITGKTLPLPDVVPLGARFREGALALDCDEQLFHLAVRTSAERSQPDSEGPWGAQLPEYYYRYRVHAPTGDPPVKGELQVRARPPRLRAKCNSEIFVASGRAAVETHLLLEAEAGSPDTIDLALSAGDGGPWQWHNETAPRGEETAINRVRRAERLYSSEIAAAVSVLAARNPLQATILLAARPNGERWRLTLARPLRGRETLRLRARRPLHPRDNHWDVPLPVVLGADRMEGEVTLHLAGADLVHLRTFGLREVASPAAKGAAPWRTFRYGQSEVGLSLSGQALAADRSTEAAIDRACLITYVGEDGVLRHHFSFQVTNWSERTLPLCLPRGSRPLAVQVDGRWLPRLLPAVTDEEMAVRSRPEPENEKMEPAELALPVPARRDAVPGDSVHRFEIVYTRTLPVWMPWQSLDAPAPHLPVAPLAFRRIWRLPLKWTPLQEGRYLSLPGTTGEGELAALPHHVADLFRLPGSWTRLDPLVEDQQAGAREALNQAIQELRGSHADQKMSLREAVSNIAFDSLKDRYTLLIDVLALREAGVGPDTLLTIKRLSADDRRDADWTPWAECGLIAVPARSAILLTTTSGRGAQLRELLSEEVETALAAAAARGQDPSGRFRSVLGWLHLDSIATADTAPPRMLDFESERADWSEWEPVAGLADDRLIVVRRDLVTGTGLTLAVLLGLVFWMLHRRPVRPRLMLLLLALGLSGLGVLWLPAALCDLAWWPLVVGCAGAVLWYLRAIVRKPRDPHSTLRKPKQVLSTATVAGLLIIGILGWHGRAAAPTPATVYLLPASADAPDKQTVLVPANLLDRLKALARPAPLTPNGPRAVLLDAAYEGQLVDEGREAEFTAVFSAYCLSNEASTLTLPLFGVRLVKEVFLDGARADPLALREPQGGYALKVHGRGRHKIELRFRAPVAGTVEDRNVLFTVPPLVRSRLSWRVPAGVSEPQILIKYGAQWTTRDAGGQRLEADLGALPRPVHLYWCQPGPTTKVTYQAAYLWDLGLEANKLTTWLRYRVEQGSVKTLEVDLPGDLEVGSAAAQRTVPASPPAWLTRFQLRDWYVTRAGNKRTLHLELPYPISGDFQVTLELLPRMPLPSRTALLLPSPHGVVEGGPRYLAYRTHVGLNAQRDTSQFLTRIGDKEFAPNWLEVPRLETNFSGVAYRIFPHQLPKLFLRLQHAPPVVQAEVDLTVQIGAHLAEIQAIAKLEASNKDLTAIEWDLPSSRCTIASVTGDDVRTWKQNGSRLLVWLNRTTEATRIRLSGWLPTDRQGERSQVALDGLRLHQPSKQHTRLRLLAGGDHALVSVRTRNLQPASPSSAARQPNESERTFETWDSSYHLDCQVQAAANAVARVLTLAEVADRELRFTTTVDYTIQYGELRHVQLRLRNWEEEKVEVQAERVSLWPGSRRSSGGERCWLLPLQPGVRKHYQVTLRGSMPLDKAAVGVPMPEVIVQGVERAEYYLAVAGGELTGTTGNREQGRGNRKGPAVPSSLLPVSYKELQRFWPGAAQRLERTGGQAWRVQNSEWQLQLLPHARTLEPAPIRVFLLEQSAAVVDGRRWLHEARCWLAADRGDAGPTANADLNIDFSAPVRVFAAAIDGIEATPLQPGPSRVWLPLPGRPGVRCIRLRWMYDAPEPLDRPNLTPPEIADAVKGTTLWTVMIPAGWEVARSSPATRLGTGPTREAALALARAEAQLHISQDLVKQHRDNVVSAALTASQQRFLRYRRHARHALDLGADRSGVVGPEGQTLAGWLESLQAQNRSLQSERGEDKETRRQGDKEKASEVAFSLSPCLLVSLSEQGGTPLSWLALPGSEPFVLQLTSRESQRIRQAFAASGQWLGGLVIVGILSFLPLLLALRLFWPEQIALLGILGWHMAGLTLVVLLLLLAAACGRVFLLARGLSGLVRKRPNQPSTMTPGSGMIA